MATIPVTLQDSLLARLDRLSSAKKVAQRASVLGREFSYPLLAATAGLGSAALQLGLARLVEAELLFARGEPPEAAYTFKHALVQEAAYASLLKRTRQQLHGRVADVLAREFPERVAAEPELVARHAERAGRIDDAIARYGRAAEQARARSAYEEAIRHLRQAIALLAEQPAGEERDAREAALQLTMGGLISAAGGYTHPAGEAAHERARLLFEAIGDAQGLGWALSGLSSFACMSGWVKASTAFSTRVIAIAEASSNTDLALRGHLDVGFAEFYEGRLASSLAHFEEALTRCEFERSYLVDSGFSTTDPGVMALANSASGLFLLGWPDRSLARAREAKLRARRIGHPYTMGWEMLMDMIRQWLRGDVAAQRDVAVETIALGEAQGFPFFAGLGRTFHAAARVASGEREAVTDLLPGLTESGGEGNRAGAPGLLCIVAGAYLGVGKLDEARQTADGALALAAQTDQHVTDSLLHRLTGEITLASGGTPAEAEAAFQRALDIARHQQARSFELRAATSLAHLWRDQGRIGDARDLLAPIYAWFSEGFDAPDLVDAKALLNELR